MNRRGIDYRPISKSLAKRPAKIPTANIDEIDYRESPEIYMEFFGPVWSKMVDICRSVKDNKITCVRASTSVSKTQTAAGLIAWFLDAWGPRKDDPGYCKVIATAKTATQAQMVLWARFRLLQLRVKDRFDGAIPSSTKFFPDPDNHPDYFAMWYNPKIEGNEATAFQGHHAPNGVLFVFEEANTIPDSVYDAAEGSLDDHNAHLLALYNPNVVGGRVYEWENDGTVSEEKGNLIHIDRFDLFNDPLYEQLRELGGMATPEGTEEMINKYGVDAPLVRIKVFGKYPLQEEAMAIKMIDIESAQDRYDEKMDIGDVTSVILPWDVAGVGKNENVLGELLVGTKGMRYRIRDKWQGFDPDMSMTRAYTHITDIKSEHPQANIVLIPDATGEGSHIPSLMSKWDDSIEIIAFKGGEVGNPIPEEPEVDISNRASEAWRAAKLILEGRYYDPIAADFDEKAIHQLTSRKEEWIKKRGVPLVWAVESKGDLKSGKKGWSSRNAGASPDRADTFVMGCWGAIAAEGVGTFDWT